MQIDSFIIHALIAGIGVALISGVIGCFVVWRRMAYFGDSLAHSSLLGIALGLTFGISTNIGIIIICAIFASLLLWLQQKKILATDTLLGILAHSGLAIGMISISLLKQNVDLHSYLFGDILTVTATELWWIYLGVAVILIALVFNWQALVLMTINEDIAAAEGVNTFFVRVLLMLLITVVVAVSIHIVGILLISSMLIIPAATARQLARRPETMAVLSPLLAMLAVIVGIYVSLIFDIPTSPAIVTSSAVIFILLFPLTALIQSR